MRLRLLDVRRANRVRLLLGATALAVAVSCTVAFAVPGDLDSGFAGDGTAEAKFSDGVDFANAVAIQADGRIVAAGAQDIGSGFALARFNPDGTLDSSFDGDGKVTTGATGDGDFAEALDVAIQPSDQKIVVSGYAYGPDGSEDFALARYNPDGGLDSGFGGGDGTLVTQFVATPDDTTFDNDRAEAVAIQADGDIVAAGLGDPITGGTVRDFAVARYESNGTLDNGFGGDGKVTQNIQGIDLGRDLLLLPGGKILVAGSTQAAGSSRNSGFVQFESDGDVDPTFSDNGLLAIDFGGPSELLGLALQADGKIVAAGSTTFDGTEVFLVTRRNVDGSPDSSFDENGSVTTQFPGDIGAAWNDVAIQADGTIVAAGFTNSGGGADFAVGRFRPDGERDSLFSCDGAVTTAFGDFAVANGLALDAGGLIVAAGSAGLSFALARYLAGGPGPDCVPPETRIKGPRKSTKPRPTFKLRSNEPGSTFECRLDNKQRFEACAPKYKPRKRLTRGKHKLFAQATDGAGNTDGSPAIKKFRIVEKKD